MKCYSLLDITYQNVNFGSTSQILKKYQYAYHRRSYNMGEMSHDLQTLLSDCIETAQVSDRFDDSNT